MSNFEEWSKDVDAAMAELKAEYNRQLFGLNRDIEPVRFATIPKIPKIPWYKRLSWWLGDRLIALGEKLGGHCDCGDY